MAKQIISRLAIPVVLAAAGVLAAAPAARAQGFGIGMRMAWVEADTTVDVDRVRFVGGQIRLGLSRRIGVELAMDRHSESFDELNRKVIDTPVQASLLLKLGAGSVSPYLLGGPGWYRKKVEALDGPSDASLNTTDFGWHAGGGLEILAGRHFGLHGDYRYTFLDFSKEEDEGLIGGIIPGYKGSMWTLGATVYF
jgi:opacity protein-like surface antigen